MKLNMKTTRRYPHFVHLSKHDIITERRYKHPNTSYTNESRLQEVSANKLLIQGLTEHGRASLDNSTSGFKSFDFGTGITLTATDNGTGVTHTASRRSGYT